MLVKHLDVSWPRIAVPPETVWFGRYILVRAWTDIWTNPFWAVQIKIIIIIKMWVHFSILKKKGIRALIMYEAAALPLRHFATDAATSLRRYRCFPGITALWPLFFLLFFFLPFSFFLLCFSTGPSFSTSFFLIETPLCTSVLCVNTLVRGDTCHVAGQLACQLGPMS